eukprot:CAMPEP_0174990728 /NCGR_PEP_ID=MMETSP0004_2-20121128/21486_1 /TAXON_ID=420556 /ORGANISM="Ochromonas sp., Strain CCMP1393" /LENGTH=81 /DNA_ID=CAMNT_0016244375 /DNA_START=191 /DNA_END=433 /DNA_ORIENTATION=+
MVIASNSISTLPNSSSLFDAKFGSIPIPVPCIANSTKTRGLDPINCAGGSKYEASRTKDRLPKALTMVSGSNFNAPELLVN